MPYLLSLNAPNTKFDYYKVGQLDGSGHEIEQIAYYSAINGYTEVAIGELTNLKNRLMYGSYIKWLITYLICNGLLILYCFLVLVFGSNVAIGEISYCLVSSTVGSFLTYTKKENDNIPMTYKYYHEVVKGTAPKNAPTYSGD